MTTAVMPPGAAGRRGAVRSWGLRRRRAANAILWSACAVALALVVAPVVWIVSDVASRSLVHWHWGLLTRTTVGQGGGLANAIVGTFVIVVGVALVAGTVGIGGGIYLAEYCSERGAVLLRGASEVLAGVPSIVLGYVGYITLVVALHWQFSLGAAFIVLSLMVVPYVVKATEVALRQVPTSYREAADGLGMRNGYALRKVVIKPALPGIATGLIVAMAIALGETAPLLYTAGWSDHFPTMRLTHSPVGYLTYVTYVFYNEPYASSHQLSHLSALLLIVFVLILIVASRVLVAATQRHAADQA
jgi:phosphate transport system permease protein